MPTITVSPCVRLFDDTHVVLGVMWTTQAGSTLTRAKFRSGVDGALVGLAFVHLPVLACKQVAATVFADASEDYSTVEAVKRRLEDWQISYPAAYRDAYMPMSAPAIFAPFVRLDLLHWDLLFGTPASGGFSSCHAGSQLAHDFRKPYGSSLGTG